VPVCSKGGSAAAGRAQVWWKVWKAESAGSRSACQSETVGTRSLNSRRLSDGRYCVRM
jgi:Tfp pilus assembly protein PilV